MATQKVPVPPPDDESMEDQAEFTLPPGEPQTLTDRLISKTPWWAISVGLHVVVALVLAHEPISARRVAKALHLEYTHVKRDVRELVRWNILSPSPEGLRFQPPPAQWEPPVVPAPAPDGHGKPPKKPEAPPAQEPEEEEEVVLRW